ncbi:MAG: phosphoribosylanthranilate isomerase [Eubacteriales bacterium]|nr:phosphoribosylanthranilate isomerase [Eubacteriales bacterium]
MAKIKICGLRSREDIEAVNKAKPDYCGFVIEFPGSFRSVTRQQARELVSGLHKEILPVGVFVNAPVELPAALLEEGTLAMAQLHGQEDEEYMARLREYTQKPVIQAFSIKEKADIHRVLASSADYILLDQGGGGTGTPFDWSLVPEITRPFFLAGGLGPHNLVQAICQVNPWAVDLSSSLETNRKKDLDKIQEAVSIVRSVRY